MKGKFLSNINTATVCWHNYIRHFGLIEFNFSVFLWIMINGVSNCQVIEYDIGLRGQPQLFISGRFYFVFISLRKNFEVKWEEIKKKLRNKKYQQSNDRSVLILLKPLYWYNNYDSCLFVCFLFFFVFKVDRISCLYNQIIESARHNYYRAFNINYSPI